MWTRWLGQLSPSHLVIANSSHSQDLLWSNTPTTKVVSSTTQDEVWVLLCPKIGDVLVRRAGGDVAHRAWNVSECQDAR